MRLYPVPHWKAIALIRITLRYGPNAILWGAVFALPVALYGGILIGVNWQYGALASLFAVAIFCFSASAEIRVVRGSRD